MHFFLYEIVARLVAIYLCVASGRIMWNGLAERKIRVFNSDLLDWGRWVVDRDSQPIQFWIQMVIQFVALAACLFVAILGWHSNT